MTYDVIMSDQQTPTFITLNELAAFLKIHPRTLHRYLAAGTITPEFRVGRSYRFSATSVLRQLGMASQINAA